MSYQNQVVPYVGTWIEIFEKMELFQEKKVVPYVGTWIEMSKEWIEEDKSIGRSLRGNVDRNLSGRRL